METKTKYALTILLTVFVTLVILFIANYYTVFGYYLPHKPQIIYMESGDISVHFRPMFILIPGNTSNLYIHTLPTYLGKENW